MVSIINVSDFVQRMEIRFPFGKVYFFKTHSVVELSHDDVPLDLQNERHSAPFVQTGNRGLDNLLDARRVSRVIYKNAFYNNSSSVLPNTTTATATNELGSYRPSLDVSVSKRSTFFGAGKGRRRSSTIMYCKSIDIDDMSDISEKDMVY